VQLDARDWPSPPRRGSCSLEPPSGRPQAFPSAVRCIWRDRPTWEAADHRRIDMRSTSRPAACAGSPGPPGEMCAARGVGCDLMSPLAGADGRQRTTIPLWGRPRRRPAGDARPNRPHLPLDSLDEVLTTSMPDATIALDRRRAPTGRIAADHGDAAGDRRTGRTGDLTSTTPHCLQAKLRNRISTAERIWRCVHVPRPRQYFTGLDNRSRAPPMGEHSDAVSSTRARTRQREVNVVVRNRDVWVTSWSSTASRPSRDTARQEPGP